MSSPEQRRPPAIHSLQWRLGLGLVAGVAVLFAGVFVLLDSSIDRALYARLDRYLLARSAAVATLLADEQTNRHPDLPTHAEALLPEFGVAGHQDFYALWNLRDELQQQSLSVGRGRFERPPHWPTDGPLFYDMTLPDGHRGHAVVRAVSLPTSGAGYLAVAQEREDVDQFERSIHYGLLGVSLLGVVLAAVLALVLVRWALRPLHRLGAAAAMLDPEQPPPVLDDTGLADELRPLAASLDRAFARLHAVGQRERRFARDVAHELRTPLAELRTRVELALRDGDAGSQREALESVLASSGRLQQSVDGLLQLARYEAGHEQPQFEPMDLAALLATACAQQRARARDRAIGLGCAHAEECWVHSDPVLLARIFDNLLGNAVAHASSGGAVEVALERRDDGIWVRIGNPATQLATADLAHFGERFWRGPGGADGHGHSGLGLALAHGIAGVLGLRLAFRLEDGMLQAEVGPLAPV
jgi:two-component system sensor histidine kinase QseC